VALDAAVVDLARRPQRLAAVRRHPHADHPPVLRGALAADQARLLHAVDHARQAALAEQDPLGDLVHAHAVVLLEPDEQVVPAEGEAGIGLQLLVEHVEHDTRALDERAPADQLLARGA
jgi:hypothetical protein